MRRLGLGGARGAVAVEFALATPILTLLLFAIVQFGVWYHAESITRTAAMEAARRAAAESASPAQGRARGEEVLRVGLGSLARNPRVTIRIQPTLVRAEIRTSMAPILSLPGFRSLGLRSTAIARREVFHPAGEKG